MVRSAFGQRLNMINLIRPGIPADMADRVVLLEDVPGSFLFGPAGKFHFVSTAAAFPRFASVVLAGGKLKALRVTAYLLRTHRGSVSKFPGQLT